MTGWRLIQDGPADGPWNMAVDEAIARAVGDRQAPPTLRLYTWDTPTVSLGYLQRASGGVNLAACREHGIALVRRATGGRAVLHAAEVTYSVAVPLQGAWGALSVNESFALVGRGLIAGLSRLGVQGTMGQTGNGLAESRGTGACFLARRSPAILVAGRKLVGSAQRRWERSLLQHGSLLVDFDPTLHQAIFPAWPRTDPSADVTCLRRLVGDVPATNRLVAALVAGWCGAMGVPCVPGALTPEEEREARILARERYATAAWTYRR